MNLSLPNSKEYAWFDYLLVAIICVLLGWFGRIWWRDANPLPIYTYQQVKVLRKYGDYHFSLEINGKETNAFFCPNYPEMNTTHGLVAGCLLKDLTYQVDDCGWDIAYHYTGYHYVTSPDGLDDYDWNGKVCYSERKK